MSDILPGLFPDIFDVLRKVTVCWCCDSTLTTKGECPLCDFPGLVSPPHVCARSGQVFGDEDGCDA